MINFFRKTRKKLADDNKFLKYSRYAIGEIVLVVIGILIALQINNWNEERKQLLNEVALSKKMVADLKDESINIKFQIINSKQRHDSYYAIFNKVKGKIKDYSGELNNSLQWTLTHRFKIKDMYGQNLNEISNENVRDLMREYISFENEAVSALDRYTLYKTEHVRPFLKRNGLYNVDSIYNIDQYLFIPEKGVQIINNDKLEQHYGSDEFNSILAESRLHITFVIGKLQFLDEFNQKFILELNNEINK